MEVFALNPIATAIFVPVIIGLIALRVMKAVAR
jgi:hypothetical protein